MEGVPDPKIIKYKVHKDSWRLYEQVHKKQKGFWRMDWGCTEG